MKKQFIFLCTVLLILGLPKLNYAELIDRGGGMLYDPDQNITWIQDLKLIYTTGYWDIHIKPTHQYGNIPAWFGSLQYQQAVTWVGKLDHGGFDDWRLPTTPGTQAGDVNEGELHYLVYEYGITVANPGLIINMDNAYLWTSNIEIDGSGTWNQEDIIWTQNFNGYQSLNGSLSNMMVLPCRDGDVSPVPVPATMLLFGSGLVGLFSIRINRMKK